MITITIVTQEQSLDESDIPGVWACWLKLTDGQDIFYLPATAPIDTKDLSAHFQAQADRLWQIAVGKGYVYEDLPQSILTDKRLVTLEGRVTDLEATA